MDLEIHYEIRHIARELQLASETAQIAEETYQAARKLGLAHGRALRVMAAASVYAAMRLKDERASFFDLIKASGESRRAITRAYISMRRKMELGIERTHSSNLVPAMAMVLGVSDVTTLYAISLAKCGERAAMGGSAHIMAATAIYFAGLPRNAPDFRSQKKVAAVAGITSVALRSRLSELKHVFEQVPVPDLIVCGEINGTEHTDKA